MGILKFAAKAVGTAVLTATGTVSAIGETFLNVAGNQDNVFVEIISGALDKGKTASFGAIKNMWSDDGVDNVVDTVEGIDGVALAKKQMANTARRMAMQAKKSGDKEKYEEYMEKYEEYMCEYNMMMANDAYEKAQQAVENEDAEKYDKYMEKYDIYEGRLEE